MLITLDREMATLINDIKWLDWDGLYRFAVQRPDEGPWQVRVSPEGEPCPELPHTREDYWSINGLLADLLTSVAHGFPMTREVGSHRYVLALLEAIRRHEADPPNREWVAFVNLG